MSEWKINSINEIINVNPTTSLKKGKISKYVPMEYLQPYTKHIYQFQNKEYKGGAKFKNGDTLVARITPCLENGKTAFVDCLDDDEVGFGSTEYIVLREKKNISDKDFIFYFSISSIFRDIAIKSMTGSSGRKRVQTDFLAEQKFKFPLLHEQKRIASVLSCLDDKIDNLRCQNETLEKIAGELFKEWFVNFNFPFDFDKEEPALGGKPYKASGGKMVDSELGEIPLGWRVGTINELASNIQYGYTQSASLENIGPKFLRITDIQGGKVNWSSVPFCEITEKDYEKYMLKSGDIVVARTGASTGENIYLYNPPKAVFASYLIRFQFEDETIGRIIGIFMRTSNYKSFVKNILGGSAQPNANANQLSEARIVVPSKTVSENFYEIVSQFDSKIYNNNSGICVLTQLRDSLLPKLMSGEVRVKE